MFATSLRSGIRGVMIDWVHSGASGTDEAMDALWLHDWSSTWQLLLFALRSNRNHFLGKEW